MAGIGLGSGLAGFAEGFANQFAQGIHEQERTKIAQKAQELEQKNWVTRSLLTAGMKDPETLAGDPASEGALVKMMGPEAGALFHGFIQHHAAQKAKDKAEQQAQFDRLTGGGGGGEAGGGGGGMSPGTTVSVAGPNKSRVSVSGKEQNISMYWKNFEAAKTKLAETFPNLTGDKLEEATHNVLVQQARSQGLAVPKEAAEIASSGITAKRKAAVAKALAGARVQGTFEAEHATPGADTEGEGAPAQAAETPGAQPTAAPKSIAEVKSGERMTEFQTKADIKESNRPSSQAAQNVERASGKVTALTQTLTNMLDDPEIGPTLLNQRGPVVGRLASVIRRAGIPIGKNNTVFDILRDQLRTAAKQAELAGTGVRAQKFLEDVQDFIPHSGDTPPIFRAKLGLLHSQMDYLKQQALFYDRPRAKVAADVAAGREPQAPTLDINRYMQSQAPQGQQGQPAQAPGMSTTPGGLQYEWR